MVSLILWFLIPFFEQRHHEESGGEDSDDNYVPYIPLKERRRMQVVYEKIFWYWLTGYNPA